MEARRLGRPRASGTTPSEQSGREEILNAAADLFTNQGYTRTSTRAIADAVGIRQSSIYYHFASKEDILGTLLGSTVADSASFSRLMLEDLAPPAPVGQLTPDVALNHAGRLFALAVRDGTQWCTSPWNLGVLYQLPETRHERYAQFHQERSEIRQAYEKLSPTPHWEGSGHLVFRLVESLITVREDGLIHQDSPLETARAGLKMLGFGFEAEREAERIRQRLLGQ